MSDDSQVLIFDDPIPRAIEFLSRYYGDAVVTEEPDGDQYREEDLLILVQDGGGQGQQHTVFLNKRITFEVRHGDRGRAAKVAAAIAGLLRNWPFIERDVYATDLGDSPTFSPEADRRIPAYMWTYGFNFRGRWQSVSDLPK